MSRYIKENERYIIETMLKDGKNPKEIAERIGKHYTTVYREIKRGTVNLLDGRTWLEVPTYCADVGQRVREERGHNKGIDIKIHDAAYLERAKYYIKELHYSPYATVEALKKEFPDTSICRGTLYNYIYNNILKGVTRDDLPYDKTPRKDSSQPRRPSLKMLGAKTIEERPKAVYERNLFGDWEMDTVVSGKKKGTSCLLVLSERTHRKEIIRKMPDRKKETVVSVLDAIEREMGTDLFKRIFRTITCDNGVEFSDWQGIEKSVDGIHNRTSVFFCHPFCSGERGTNENNNKLIRRFVPKGSRIEDYTEEQIQYIEDWINNYPRKLFGGHSSNELAQISGTIP